MLSDVDFSDETLSFAFDGSNDEIFNFEMSNMLGDINFDNLNIPDEVLGENIFDISDSDSGISNHGDKHPFLCDIEQGKLDVPGSNFSSETVFFPSATTVSSDTVDSDPCNNTSYSQSQRKRPKPQEPLITGFAPVTSRQISSSSFGVSRTLSVGSVPLKLEPRNFTSTIHQIPASQAKSGEIINHHLPPKMPRILSRGQNSVSRFMLASSNQPAFVQPTPFCYNVTPSVNISKPEIADSSEATTASISDAQQQQQKPHLLPSVVSLPVIDELTFSNSFHVISPPTETESIEKLVKKQERMIKNRQAACLSRLRKKEYLERLEIRLDQLRQENAHLRQENNEWRNRYDILEKSLGDLQAEYASLRRVSHTSTGGGSEDSASSSSSTSSLNQSSLLSPSATTAPSVPRFAPTTQHAVLPKSSKQQTSALPLQQSLLLSTTSSSRFSNCITSKISLLRKSQQPTDRIVLQKPTTGNTGGISPLGSGSRFLPVVGGGGSNITLPCGVRKKVTTSLFILACLFAVNFSVTSFGQLSSPFSVVAMTSEYDNRILKPSIISRALFSVPVASDNHSEATAVGQQTRKDLTNMTTVNDKPPVNVTATVVTAIGRCHPDEIIDLMNQQMWLVLDNEDDDTELPLLELQKETAHSRHVNSASSSNLTVSPHELPPSERRRLIHDSLSSRFQHNKPKRAFLVRSPVKEEDEAEWNEANGLTESLHPENDAPLLSNLTIFLQNSSKLSNILPSGVNSTEKSIRLCKLQVKVSSLKDLRRRWKV